MGLLALCTGLLLPNPGALLGAALVSMSGRVEVAQWPAGTRTVWRHRHCDPRI